MKIKAKKDIPLIKKGTILNYKNDAWHVEEVAIDNIVSEFIDRIFGLELESDWFEIIEDVKPYVDTWEDLKEIQGFYINDFSSIYEIKGDESADAKESSKKMFATKKQAKSALAYAQLTQLMNQDYFRFEPDWSQATDKYVINLFEDWLKIEEYMHYYSFLAFETEQKAEEFLKAYEPLIRQFYMLD